MSLTIILYLSKLLKMIIQIIQNFCPSRPTNTCNTFQTSIYTTTYMILFIDRVDHSLLIKTINLVSIGDSLARLIMFLPCQSVPLCSDSWIPFYFILFDFWCLPRCFIITSSIFSVHKFCFFCTYSTTLSSRSY